MDLAHFVKTHGRSPRHNELQQPSLFEALDCSTDSETPNARPTHSHLGYLSARERRAARQMRMTVREREAYRRGYKAGAMARLQGLLTRVLQGLPSASPPPTP